MKHPDGAYVRPKLTERTAAFVESFRRSTERTRIACGLTAVLCIVSLAAFNNLRNENWGEARLRLYAGAQTKFVNALKAGQGDETSLTTIAGNDSELGDTAIRFRDSWGIGSLKQLKEFVGKRTEGVAESRRVSIPVAGLSFDSNDMGTVFGLSFIVFSVFLYKSARRERRSTITTFEQAEAQGELALAYEMMSLEEVLMRPDNLDPESSSSFKELEDRPKVRKLLDSLGITTVLAWLPFFCLLMISVFDYASISVGLEQSAVSTWIVVGAESLSLAILFFVGLETMQVIREIRQIWATARDKAQSEIDARSNPTSTIAEKPTDLAPPRQEHRPARA